MSDLPPLRPLPCSEEEAHRLFELSGLMASHALRRHPEGDYRELSTQYHWRGFRAALRLSAQAAQEGSTSALCVAAYQYTIPPAQAAQGETPVDDKAHPRFIAGYEAGLKDECVHGVMAAQEREVRAHELWAAAQLVPGEGIEDGVMRIEALLKSPVDDASIAEDAKWEAWRKKDREALAQAASTVHQQP